MPEDDSIVPSMRWGCGNPKTSPTEQQAVMHWLHGNIIDTPVNGPHPGKATCKAHEHGRSLPSNSQYSECVRARSDSLPTQQLLHTSVHPSQDSATLKAACLANMPTRPPSAALNLAVSTCSAVQRLVQ